MLDFIIGLIDSFLSTVQDVAPIVLLIAFFQILVLKKNIPDLRKVTFGVVLVIFGLSFFLIGLERALFPLGETMAFQLSAPEFISNGDAAEINWQSYYWVYLFALLVGFATTIAEPSLKAVAIKANAVSGGTISEWNLRLVVALGAGLALAIGTHRIVIGIPLYYYIIAAYIIVLIQTIFAPKNFVGLAYDSGGVTTSTVTVPIVAALGLGLSSVVPGRDPALDGFGLIALVCMFPIITVLAYAQIVHLIAKYKK